MTQAPERKLRKRTRVFGTGLVPLNGTGGGYGTYTTSKSSNISSFDPQTALYEPFKGREICVDEIRPGHPRKPWDPLYFRELSDLSDQLGDKGGEFWVKRETARHGTAGSQTCRRGRYFARGVVIHSSAEPAESFSDSWFYSDPRPSVDPFSATGWARFNPGAPDAGLGQALAELRELPKMGLTTFRRLPEMLQGRSDFYRGIGDQYLNVVFGWKPFLRDVRDMFALGQTITHKLNQLARDNGHGVRRGGTILKARSQTQSSVSSVSLGPTGVTYLQNNTGARKCTLYTKTDEVWFSARFRYFIPGLESPWWRIKAAFAAIGAAPTPHLVWQVVPWSWLIDWFSNVGDVIENVSYNAAENLSADYAYTMRHTRETWQITANRNYSAGSTEDETPSPNSLSTFSSVNEFMREEKVRVRATPFGVAMTDESLSARQWAILTALGLAFLPRL